jgi:hypothetical protein
MTDEEYNKARSAIVGVFIARWAAVILAVVKLFQGDWVGAGFLLVVAIFFLNFLLPVEPNAKKRRR